MTTVAAVDCGTNSIRLLIARVEADGRLVDVDRRMQIVRLGQGVDATGRLAPEALRRTRDALTQYRAAIDEYGAARVRMVATSATRDAANRDEFDAMVVDVLGHPAEVITGDEEAALSFAGAVTAVPADAAGPVLVVDIGGGSTEVVLGDASTQTVSHGFSMDIGSVRLTERHFAADPPTADQIVAAEADIARHLVEQPVPLADARTVVGVAGTVTTVAALAQDLPRYDHDRVDGFRLTSAEAERVTADLLAMDHDARSALPALHPGRVDVIAAGSLILRAVLRATGAAELITSERDILDGIAATLV